MREPFNILVLDTETHFMNIYNKMVFDIAWCEGDVRNSDSKIEEKRFLIKEFMSPKHWRHSYTDKATGLRKDWKADSRGDETVDLALSPPKGVKVVSWNEMLEELEFSISRARAVGSYNWAFDRGAIENTSLKLNHKPFLQGIKFKPFCIQDMFVNKIINRDYFSYIDNDIPEYEKDLYKSKSGKNLGYSAEIMARYISRNSNYVESHTALDDSRVEFTLCRYFCDRHFTEFKNNFLGNPKSVSWTKVRDRLSSAKKMKARD